MAAAAAEMACRTVAGALCTSSLSLDISEVQPVSRIRGSQFLPSLRLRTSCDSANDHSRDFRRHARKELSGAWGLGHCGSRLGSFEKSGVQNDALLLARAAAAAGVSSGYGNGVYDAFGDPFAALASQAPAMAQRGAEADVMGLLLRQRIVFLGHQMDDFVADAIISQLLLLDAVDPTKDIRLFVNCPGGSISAAMGIYDSIQLCRANVSTVAFGLAASTATIVLAGGSKGKRFAMPNTRVMMHQPLGGASGQAIDVEIQAREIMYHKNNITRIISEITGRPFEQVSKDMDRDRYMSPVEAMEYGLIDGVIDEDTIIPLAPNIEKVKQRSENILALEDPSKFLNPDIPDDEIY